MVSPTEVKLGPMSRYLTVPRQCPHDDGIYVKNGGSEAVDEIVQL